MHDLETLQRSIIRRFVPRKSKSSLPLISGDSYKIFCNFQISPDFVQDFQVQIRNAESMVKPTFFISGDLVEIFSGWINSNFRFVTPHGKLIIHNSDFELQESMARILKKVFNEIYSVNWMGSHENVYPIPIGLENSKLLRNGVPRDFLIPIRLGLPNRGNRPIKILNSYSLKTNQTIRSKAQNFFMAHEDAHTPTEFLTPRHYRRLVTQSEFVVSPPGNGYDCHRTWEAIYLGAVPIVLKEYWPFQKYRLPVLAVDNWEEAIGRLHEEFVSLDPYELKKLFFDSVFE